MKGRNVPASWNHATKKLAEIVSALQSQLTGVFNWCLAGARHGCLLTHSVLTIVDAVTHTLQAVKSACFSSITWLEVTEQSFEAKPVIQRPGLSHLFTWVDGSITRIPETGLAQGVAIWHSRRLGDGGAMCVRVSVRTRARVQKRERERDLL